MGSTGKELYIDRIDENAKWKPHHTFARVPKANWETEGYQSITHRQYANGINKIAHWLDETFGKSVDNDTFAYFGGNDIRYAFVFAALNKSNRKFLCPEAGRIIHDGLKSLLKETGCKVWLYTEAEDTAHVMSGLEGTEVKLQPFPSLEWCLDAEGTAPYPYDKTYEESKHQEILILHTSGTTGLPKPNRISYGFWAAGTTAGLLSRRHFPRGISTDVFHGRTAIMACPMRWNPSLVMLNMFGVFSDTCCVLPPPVGTGLAPDVYQKLLQFNKVEGIVATPHSIVEIYNNESTRESLKSLEFITYLGATLDRSVGDALCEHTRLSSVIGSTETGGRFSFHPRDRKLWYSWQFIPEHHVRLVPLEDTGAANGGSADSNVYRVFVDRPPGGEPSLFQCAFWNLSMFKDVETIDTKELYRPVKDIDGSTRWEFVARADDWIKLIWMAKFYAQDIETEILRYPGIKNVLVGGMERPAPFVIIEAKDELLETKSAEELVDDIYQTKVLGANKNDIKAMRIPRETVFLAKKEKPFKMNLKEVVLRREVEKDYQAELEEAYENLKKNQEAGAAKFVELMR